MTMIHDALAAQGEQPYEQAWSMPGAFYCDHRVLSIERERLFAREWLCVGRVEEVAYPGDYLSLELLEEPVVVIHGRDGEIRAFSNVCRHRGTLLCDHQSGHVGRIVCPYHQWAYARNGELVSCRGMNDEIDILHGAPQAVLVADIADEVTHRGVIESTAHHRLLLPLITAVND